MLLVSTSDDSSSNVDVDVDSDDDDGVDDDVAAVGRGKHACTLAYRFFLKYLLTAGPPCPSKTAAKSPSFDT